MFRLNVRWFVSAAVLIGALASPNLASADPFDSTLCPANPPTAINGVGSSFQSNAISGFITAYVTACSLNPSPAPVTYGGGGSGAGIASQINRTAQFGGTDVPYTTAQWDQIRADGTPRASPVETIPIAIGGVGLACNLSCSIPPMTSILLRSNVIAGMYTGAITSWSDPRIIADNAFLATCTDPVFLTARAEASGTTFAFKDYVSKRNAEFRPPDSSTTWPPGANIRCRGAGNPGMVACVTNNVGAIGYIDFSDIGVLPTASVESSDLLSYDLVSGACVAAAAGATVPATTELNWAGVSMTDTAGAYPICTFTYDLVFKNPTTAGTTSGVAQATNLKAFAAFAVSDEGQATLDMRYDPLPLNVQQIAQAGAAALVTGGPIPPPGPRKPTNTAPTPARHRTAVPVPSVRR